MLATIPVLETPTLNFIPIRFGKTVVVKNNIEVFQETLSDNSLYAGLITSGKERKPRAVFFSEKPIPEYRKDDEDKVLDICCYKNKVFGLWRLIGKIQIEEVQDVPDIYHLINGAGITK